MLSFLLCACLSFLACGGSEDDAEGGDAKTLHCAFRDDGAAHCQERVVDGYYAPTTEQAVRGKCDDASFLRP